MKSGRVWSMELLSLYRGKEAHDLGRPPVGMHACFSHPFLGWDQVCNQHTHLHGAGGLESCDSERLQSFSLVFGLMKYSQTLQHMLDLKQHLLWPLHGTVIWLPGDIWSPCTGCLAKCLQSVGRSLLSNLNFLNMWAP